MQFLDEKRMGKRMYFHIHASYYHQIKTIQKHTIQISF